MNAIDTNILIYSIDDTFPDKRHRALELLLDLNEQDTPLILLWQVAVEYLACLRRWENAGKYRREDTAALLSEVLNKFTMAYPNAVVLHHSLELSSRYSLSHWDSLLIAACHDAGVKTLYSEDLAHGMRYGDVTVMNPFATSV